MRRKGLQIFCLVLSLALAIPTSAQPAPDQPAGTTERVSVSSAGTEGSGASGNDLVDAAVSADGRTIAFVSRAANLVSGDTNGQWDIFVRDRAAGQTRRVSVSSSGAQANDVSSNPAISADGRYVAFTSYATNLVGSDQNRDWDIFVHDLSSGQTTLASLSSAGAQAAGGSNLPSLSADGRYVAFDSGAYNLIAGDGNNAVDVFRRDRHAGQTERISISADEAEGNGDSRRPSISDDGRYIAFHSEAGNLVAGDNNGKTDVFVRDFDSGATIRVSVSTTGIQADGDSMNAAMSADGRFVSFVSYAANLVPGDDNGDWDVFIHDLWTNTTNLVSVAANGGPGTGGSNSPSVSTDGRFVVFDSGAWDLVGGDSNGATDVFLHDRQAGATTRLSVSTGNAQGDGDSRRPVISDDGSIIAFSSLAKNLVAGDGNNARDIFANDRAAGQTSPPDADFSANPTSGAAPLAVQFYDQSSGQVSSWSWTFGDGGSSSQRNPQHTYVNPGSYTVSLTASGPGGSDIKTWTGYITVGQAPVASFGGCPASGERPLTVQFTDQSGGAVTSRSWSFGDGGSSSQPSPIHTYTSAGVYTVSLTVNGPYGSDQETYSGCVTVTDPASTVLTAGFSANPRAGRAPLTVQFTDQSSGEIDSWSWSFGDGGSSSAKNPSYTYQVPGVYTVSLAVTGPGGMDEEVKAGVVVVEADPAQSNQQIFFPPLSKEFVCLLSGTAEQENNDDYLHANGPVAPGEDVYGYADDLRDYFAFDLPTLGTFAIDLYTNTGKGVQLQLFYGSATVENRVDVDLMSPYHLELVDRSAGRYYIYIYTASEHNSSECYRLRVTLRP